MERRGIVQDGLDTREPKMDRHHGNALSTRLVCEVRYRSKASHIVRSRNRRGSSV